MEGMRNRYSIVSYAPLGDRHEIATLWGLDRNHEAGLSLAGMVAGVSVGGEGDGMVETAKRHACLLGEYVDLLRNDEHIATVGPEGAL